MHLRFPNLDSLRLALTSGALPASLHGTPARYAVGPDQALWVQTDETLAESARRELRRLGVRFPRSADVALDAAASHWLQLLPLARTPGDPRVDARTAVLFELANPDQLAQLATEILRLGNDRQGFRWVELAGAERAYLRVIGPPYYSLLRALEGEAAAPRAYREAAPGVWVEVGYEHPLGEHLRPPAGHWLLVRAPREWAVLPEGKLRDIYDVLDFTVPAPAQAFHEVEPARPIAVPVRLTRSGGTEPAELWLLREPGIAALEELVHSADNALLARLAFAVGESDGARCVLLRVRPSRNPPPVLVLEGIAFRPYLRLPNLFLPIGTSLHPPLRRDAVQRLLADDKTRVTWLVPGPDGTFTPQSLPDASFRPLSDWVDYVLEHAHEALTAWMGAMQFQFESFVCTEDVEREKKPKEPPAPKPTKSPAEPPAATPPAPPAARPEIARQQPAAPLPTPTPAAPSERAARLRALEEAFLALEVPLEDPQRQRLWREMAELNGALQHHGDAGLCWCNALWEEEHLRAEAVQAWLDAEASAGAGPALLLRLVAKPEPSGADLRLATVLLLRAGAEPTPPAELRPHLARIQQFVERHEPLVGVRQAWLTWLAVHRIAGGDVLTLVRARDRLLERLHLHGMTPDLDLPGFLRFTGQHASQRFRLVREQVVQLRPRVHDWSGLGPNPTRETHTYIDLLFAFGLARLGENTESRRLLHDAREALAAADDIHRWLVDAFSCRIEQALDGKPATERLPEPLLHRLEEIEHPAYLKDVDPVLLDAHKQHLRMTRLKIERLRTKSRVLEPVERLHAYRHWVIAVDDELQRELTALTDLVDRAEITQRLDQLFTGKRKIKNVAKTDPRILLAALELAPRLGQAFAERMLDQVPSQIARLKDSERFAEMLEKTLFLAAHCDRRQDVQRCVAQFGELLSGARPLPHEKLIALVIGSFRSLRKLGMRDTAAELLQRLENLVEADPTLRGPAASGQAGAAVGKRLCLLLELAGAWYAFEAEAKARKALDAARDTLLRKELHCIQQAEVAAAYLTALGQAPMDFALERIAEFFGSVEGVYDNFTTTSHYSLTRLSVVEAMILAIANDDFTIDRAARKRLDDDEFLVRRRIHRDVRTALAQAGM